MHENIQKEKEHEIQTRDNRVFVSLINFLLSATDFHFIEIDLDQRSHMETGYFFNAI